MWNISSNIEPVDLILHCKSWYPQWGYYSTNTLSKSVCGLYPFPSTLIRVKLFDIFMNVNAALCAVRLKVINLIIYIVKWSPILLRTRLPFCYQIYFYNQCTRSWEPLSIIVIYWSREFPSTTHKHHFSCGTCAEQCDYLFPNYSDSNVPVTFQSR